MAESDDVNYIVDDNARDGSEVNPSTIAPVECSTKSPSGKVPSVKAQYSLVDYQPTEMDRIAHNAALQSINDWPTTLTTIGCHELLLPALYKSLMIEFFGTATFIYVHVAIVAACQSYVYPPLQIGIGHAILLSFFILQFAMSSGAHFNAMITMTSIATGHILPVRGLLYIVVQIFGATAGAEVMRKCISENLAQSILLGGCNIGTLDEGQALAIEFFFSITLLFTVYGTAFNKRQREIYGPVLPPFLIGSMLGLIIFASASLAPPPFTGVGANPSMCLGTAWSYSNIDSNAMDNHWIYWTGPLIAIVVHTVIYTVAPPHHDDTTLTDALKKQS